MVTPRRTALITGANGFVGAALCRALLADGWRVVGAVRDPGAILLPGVERAIVPEIGPRTDWTAALRGADSVVHLAARVHVPGDQGAEALESFRAVNTYGTRRLAESAAAQGVKTFVFISSVKALGDGLDDGQAYLDTDPAKPLDAYGRSKAEGEEAVETVGRTGTMGVVTLRPPLTYGPDVRANFYSLLRLCDSPLPLPLGGIENRRSLLALDNLVAAILFVLTRPEAAGGKYLLRDGEDLSTPHLAARIRQALARPARIWTLPAGLTAVLDRIGPLSPALKRLTGSLTVDDSGIRRLGFTPPIGVDEGLTRVVQWWRTGR